ncbi:MAG: flotillin family protein [Calothrix sp. MO_167.B42]|nr:flotillin family protein [Calothrix sp. MO_167.B42]
MPKLFVNYNVSTTNLATVQPSNPTINPITSIHKQQVGRFIGASVPIALGIFGAIVLVWFIKSFLCICKPNEVLVISGRKWRTQDGQEVGYRVLAGGRAIRIPIIETIKRMDVTTMPVPVEVRNAYSKGGTPLDIQAIANVKVSSDRGIVGNAIERFLNSDRKEITRVARETLEGNLRGVVATLTPEQVNEDRLQFAERITSDVSRDLTKLGLQLDTLKIQSVSDSVEYLSSIGRKRIAIIIQDAEIAESDALGEAQRIEAECEQQAEVAQTQNKISILEKENELRELKAKLEKQARSEEEITIATANEKRAKFEQKLQALRAELERLRLEADEVLPAKAAQQAQELQARGEAANLAENAKAAALVNQMLTQVWQETGKDASQLFLIQQIETILQDAVKIPSRLSLDKITVVDNGDGKSLAGLVQVYPEILSEYLESINKTLGIDVVGTLTGSK